MPPSLNLDNVGGHKDDDSSMFNKFDYIPNESKQKPVNYSLCNSFGFGGTNSSLCLSKYK